MELILIYLRMHLPKMIRYAMKSYEFLLPFCFQCLKLFQCLIIQSRSHLSQCKPFTLCDSPHLWRCLCWNRLKVHDVTRVCFLKCDEEKTEYFCNWSLYSVIAWLNIIGHSLLLSCAFLVHMNQHDSKTSSDACSNGIDFITLNDSSC